MEISRFASARLSAGQTYITLRLPPFVTLICYIFIILIGLMIVLIGLATHQQATNPFGLYADLFPGNSQEDAINSGFGCSVPSLAGEPCVKYPAQGPFSQIYVFVTNNQIRQVEFIPAHHSTITIGDIAIRWGRPRIQKFGRLAFLSWPQHRITASSFLTINGVFNYFLPIDHITFESTVAVITGD